MPEFWTAVRRWVDPGAAVVVSILTATAVVGGALWLAITPDAATVNLVAGAAPRPLLSDVRPDDSSKVDPRLAAAVDAILARRGKAVRTNDQELFLRDVGPELRAKQRRLFSNMRAIGMTVTYRRAEPWTDFEAQRRFGEATGTFRVSMRYQLFGTRLAQAATDVGYTFTVRSGRLYLVDDDNLDGRLGAGRQPWDFGPVKAVRRPGALVIVDADEAGLGHRLAEDTVSVAKRVRKLWPGPLQHVPVIVAMTDRRVLTGSQPTPDGDEPAVVQAMRSPAIEGRPIGGWVVVRPDVRQLLNRIQLAHVLVHLAAVRLGDEAPRWLAEGLAEYAANQQRTLGGQGGQVAQKRRLVSKNSLRGLAALPADDAFRSAESYDISWLAIDHLIREIGIRNVTDFYLQVAFRGYNPELRARLMEEQTGFTDEKLVESLRSLAG
jgi:hypothetical protein